MMPRKSSQHYKKAFAAVGFLVSAPETQERIDRITSFVEELVTQLLASRHPHSIPP